MPHLDLYRAKIQDLIDKTTNNGLDIFDYELSPYFEEFDEIFGFYQETLESNIRYGITPCLIYFNNNLNINASAGKRQKYFIVTLNMGTVVELIRMFREYDDILLNNNQQNFELRLDNSINELMYQFSLHYTFYHEMAHLIQKSTFLGLNMDENLDLNQNFNEFKHLLELDADEYSAISLGTHIIQYADRIFGAEITEVEIEELLVIGCSSILLYLLSFESNRLEIYYEEYSHPHPIIRLNWIIFSIISYCENSYNQKGIQININSTHLMNKVLAFSKANIQNFFDGDDLITNYTQILEVEALNFLTYYNKYQGLKKRNKKLAVNKWNILASNRNSFCKCFFFK